MSAWSEGYVHDIDYTHGYYEELNPYQMTIPFLIEGLALPKVGYACELGFGQGLSVNVHAAAGVARWYATDFNPAQAHNAQHLAEKAGTADESLFVSDQGFAEFCARDDLPMFDFIALHGIWTWVSDENRRIIVDFLARKLKIGGVLYVSYNVLPGWSVPAPIRHLLTQYDTVMATSASNRADNAKKAVAFGSEVINLSHALLASAPTLKERIEGLKTHSPNYLAHEYLNRDWQPMYFADMNQWLSDAKLSFACSAHYLDDFAAVLYNDEQKRFMDDIENPTFAQSIKDYLVNKQFRRDYWVKGARKLSRLEQLNEWRKLSVMWVSDVSKFEPSIANVRKVDILTEMYTPVVDYLGDGKPHAVADIIDALADSLDSHKLLIVLALLHAKNDIVLYQTNVTDETRARCQALNAHILEQGVYNQEINHLASPVTGGGVAYGYIERLFLLAHQQGVPEDDWAQAVWTMLKSINNNLVKEGQALIGDEANLSELTHLKDEFLAHRFPLAKKLQIISA